jgi:hypothetical protein
LRNISFSLLHAPISDSTDSRFYSHKTNLQLPTNNMAPMQYPDTMQDTNYGPLVRNPFIQSPLVDQYRPQIQQQQQPQPWLPQQRIEWPQQSLLPQDTQTVYKPAVEQPTSNVEYVCTCTDLRTRESVI